MMRLVTLLTLIGLVPGQAFAHMVFNQQTVQPDQLATLELRITHGCKGQATHTVRVKIPEGVTRVTPRFLPGWSVSVEKRALATPVNLHGQVIRETADVLVWSSGNLPDQAYEQFEFRAQMPSRDGQVLYFPVEQICATERHDWVEIPANVANWGRLVSPAPFVTVASAPGPTPRKHQH
jgi:periplasmic copper chaperone A